MKQKELRQLIQERVRTGRLPPAFGGQTSGGRGCDSPCDCCGQIIARHEMVHQVGFTPLPGESRKTFSTHIECHWIWWEESGLQGQPAASPPGPSLAWNALRELLKPQGRSLN